MKHFVIGLFRGVLAAVLLLTQAAYAQDAPPRFADWWRQGQQRRTGSPTTRLPVRQGRKVRQPTATAYWRQTHAGQCIISAYR